LTLRWRRFGNRARKGRRERCAVAAKLEAIAACGDQATRIWQGYLDKPGAPGDNTRMSWVGAERAKQAARAEPPGACAGEGRVRGGRRPRARFLVLDESPIVLAYRGLKKARPGRRRAQAMHAEQQATNKHLARARRQVACYQVDCGEAGGQGVKKPVAKRLRPGGNQEGGGEEGKSAKKPAARKAVKKAAKKK